MCDEEENTSPNSGIKGDAKSIPSLYKMELTKGFFSSKRETEPVGCSEMSDTHSFNLEESQEHEGTFNAWKAKNRAYNQSQADECSPGMVSNLGKSLRQFQYVVPKTSSYNSNMAGSSMKPCDMGSPNQAHNMQYSPGISRKAVPCSFEQPTGHFLENHMNPNQYYEHENHTPVKCCGNGHFLPNPIPNFYTPMPCQSYDVPSKKLPHYSPSARGNYTSDYNHYRQPNNWSPNNHQMNSKDAIRAMPYCRINQQKDEVCNCSANSNKGKIKKSNKKDEKQTKQISDLYRIVYLQNQQLGLLQKQVQKLIEVSLKEDNSNSQECGGTVLNKKYVKGTSEKRTFNLSVIKENEKVEEKVSVGIMTSFVENNYATVRSDKEVKVFPKNFRSKSPSDSDESSDESSSNDEEPAKHTPSKRIDKNNVSFTLNDVVVPAIEENPSPTQTSFHIEMQEYKTSSESDSESETSSSESDVKSPSPVGWTFYDNVVGKVNDMLKQSSLDKEDNHSDEDEVRNATIDRLRQLGVSFVEPESPLTKRVTFNNRNTRTKLTSRQQLQCDTETSMHMNALANKYLKKEEFLLNGTAQETQKGQNNLSHATLKYLERYQLSPNDKNTIENGKPEKIKKKKKKKKQTNKEVEIVRENPRQSSRQNKCGKILDITAIKKQPKLLPKNL